MFSTRRLVGVLFLAVCLAGAAFASRPADVGASDHNEPQSINALGADPFSTEDDLVPDAGDIYGNFAWPTDDSLVLILTFPAPYYGFGSGYEETTGDVWDETSPNAYDPNVLYTFHLDVDRGGILTRNITNDDYTIHARFGYDAERQQWGVRVEGIPGEDEVVVGPIGTELSAENGARVQAGLFDEPFFVDLERFFLGLQADESNLAAANLSFRPDVDFFRGLNVHAIVIEIPKEHVASRWRRQVNVWNTTHRIPGDPGIREGNDCEETK